MKTLPTFVIASNNSNKTNELIECFNFLGLHAQSYQDFIAPLEFPNEATTTYLDNARGKALFIAKYLPEEWVIADDSGMELQALPDELGVTTARQLKPCQNMNELNDKILALVANKSRIVKMVSQLVLITSNKVEFIARGEFKGTIATRECGTNGTSFDLILVPQGMQQTLAQLPDREKLPLLHRTKAIKNLISQLGD